MYNRYLEFIPEELPQATDVLKASPPCDEKPKSIFGDTGSILTGLFNNLHFDFDDLLLLGIIWLMLKDSGDDDVIIIIAALFFTGFFNK